MTGTRRHPMRLVGATALVAVAGVVGLIVLGGAATTSTAGDGTGVPGRVPGIPPVVLDAYLAAAAATGELAPDCAGVEWWILAGIGYVETRHAAGHQITGDGEVTPPIFGPRLDGTGDTQHVPDTDNGHWDNDTSLDRAAGPMQFLPGTWDGHGRPGSGDGLGRDGNDDGTADPHNVFDAAHAAVVHLCGTGPRDLSDPQELVEALYGYNPSQAYVDEVTERIDHYRSFQHLPDDQGSGTGAEILKAAVRWEGTPYSWGGGDENGPTYGGCCSPSGKTGATIKGFDCSGLVIHALAQVGITGVPHRATLQWEQAPSWGGVRIPASAGLDALQPGDLVFFSDDGHYFPHVGIYAGDGRMFNAARPDTTLRYDPIRDNYHSAIRF